MVWYFAMYNDQQQVTAYIDGSCLGNPGPGGWGVVLKYGRHSKQLSGGEYHTTNNRMEIMAAIEALKALNRSMAITLVTDSTYLKNGITSWIATWTKNHWRTASKKAVKNKDLWLQLDQLVQQHHITWQWVKGHSGDAGNELADRLARKAAERFAPAGGTG